MSAGEDLVKDDSKRKHIRSRSTLSQIGIGLHEALTQIPSADHPPMTIMQVVERGYRIHDRVIRPAKVVVSCAPPDAG